jgi:hypothetical protein
MRSRVGDMPEVKRALAKAKECAKLASVAKTDDDRNFHERMRRNGSASLMDGV